jgi:Ni,Fe-hydrogenase III small subunit
MFVGRRAFGKQLRVHLATMALLAPACRSHASAGGVAEVLPVDVFIPGCPPRPEASIFGILFAVGRIDVRGSTPPGIRPPRT